MKSEFGDRDNDNNVYSLEHHRSSRSSENRTNHFDNKTYTLHDTVELKFNVSTLPNYAEVKDSIAHKTVMQSTEYFGDYTDNQDYSHLNKPALCTTGAPPTVYDCVSGLYSHLNHVNVHDHNADTYDHFHGSNPHEDYDECRKSDCQKGNDTNGNYSHFQ